MLSVSTLRAVGNKGAASIVSVISSVAGLGV
jgi:hypothetical protein